MHLPLSLLAVTTALASLVSSAVLPPLTPAATTPTSSGAAIVQPPRPGPIIGGFNLATANSCPMDYPQIAQHININYGEACGTCVALKPASDQKPFVAIQDAIMNPWCHMIVYSTSDCSGTGILTGEGCWAPEGGIKAYRVECPYWEGVGVEEMKPCNADS